MISASCELTLTRCFMLSGNGATAVFMRLVILDLVVVALYVVTAFSLRPVAPHAAHAMLQFTLAGQAALTLSLFVMRHAFQFSRWVGGASTAATPWANQPPWWLVFPLSGASLSPVSLPLQQDRLPPHPNDAHWPEYRAWMTSELLRWAAICIVPAGFAVAMRFPLFLVGVSLWVWVLLQIMKAACAALGISGGWIERETPQAYLAGFMGAPRSVDLAGVRSWLDTASDTYVCVVASALVVRVPRRVLFASVQDVDSTSTQTPAT